MGKQANPTSEQQDQVRKSMDSDHQSLRVLFTQLRAANNQRSDKLLATGTVQAADLEPQVQKIAQLRQQLMEQGVKTTLAVRAVLTPQQLANAAQLKDQLQKLRAGCAVCLKVPNSRNPAPSWRGRCLRSTIGGYKICESLSIEGHGVPFVPSV